jgi:hypothetical protein
VKEEERIYKEKSVSELNNFLFLLVFNFVCPYVITFYLNYLVVVLINYLILRDRLIILSSAPPHPHRRHLNFIKFLGFWFFLKKLSHGAARVGEKRGS